MTEAWSEQSRSQFNIFIRSAVAAVAAALCDAILLWLCFIIVRRVALFVPGSLNLTQVFSLSSFERVCLVCPFAVLSRLGPRFPITSVITVIRRAKAGVRSPVAKNPFEL